MTKEISKVLLETTMRNTTFEVSPQMVEEYERRKAKKLEEAFAEEQMRFQVNRMNTLLKRSGLEMAIQTKTFDSFKVETEWQKKMKDKVMRWVNNPSGWILISGQSGCGKTHICTAAAGELLRRGKELLYMLWRQDSFKMSRYTDDAEKARREYSRANFLYIDDLFKGGGNENEIRMAFEILDARYREKLPTIISTEFTLDEIESIDTGIHGRITEMCRGNMVVIKRSEERNRRINE